MASTKTFVLMSLLRGGFATGQPGDGMLNFRAEPLCAGAMSNVQYSDSAVFRNLTDPKIYDKLKRPSTAYTPTSPVSGAPEAISVQFGVASVINVDQKLQELTLQVYESMMWNDKRLVYDNFAEGRCMSKALIKVNAEAINGAHAVMWSPSTIIVNQRKATQGEAFGQISTEGEILFVKQKQLTLACPMHFGAYPFDTQSCPLTFSHFAQELSELNLTAGIQDSGQLVDLDTYLPNLKVGEFAVLEKSHTEYAVYTQGRTDYKYLTGFLELERHADTFWLSVFMPDLALHAAIFSSFFIPATATPARVTLIIISALAFRIIMSSLYAALPPVTYSVWVVDYMVGSQLMSVLALFYFVFVLFNLAREKSRASRLKVIANSGLPKRVEALLGAKEGTKRNEVWEEVFEDAQQQHRLFVRAAQAAMAAGEQTQRVAGEDDGQASGSVKPPSLQSRSSSGKVAVSRNDMSLDDAATQGGGEDSVLLTTADVANMAFIADVYASFDRNSSQTMGVLALRRALRFFGLYYSSMEVCSLVEAYRSSQGSSLAEAPFVDRKDFFLVLVNHEKFSPVDDGTRGFWAHPPSVQLDVVARVAYPILTALKVGLFFAVIELYE